MADQNTDNRQRVTAPDEIERLLAGARIVSAEIPDYPPNEDDRYIVLRLEGDITLYADAPALYLP